MVIKLSSGFEILRFSDLSYEGMTVELQYKGEQIAQINMDMGVENMELELFTEFVDKQFVPKFPLKDFLIALEKAREILAEYK